MPLVQNTDWLSQLRKLDKPMSQLQDLARPRTGPYARQVLPSENVSAIAQKIQQIIENARNIRIPGIPAGEPRRGKRPVAEFMIPTGDRKAEERVLQQIKSRFPGVTFEYHPVRSLEEIPNLPEHAIRRLPYWKGGISDLIYHPATDISEFRPIPLHQINEPTKYQLLSTSEYPLLRELAQIRE